MIRADNPGRIISRQVWHHRRGTSSLLLIAVTLPLVLVLTTSLAIARRETDEAKLVRAMRAQLQVSLADYDPALFSQFGLFGVNPDRLKSTVYQELTPRRFSRQPVQLSLSQSIFEQEALVRQIDRTMKLRLPMLWFNSFAKIKLENNVAEASLDQTLETALETTLDPVQEISPGTAAKPSTGQELEPSLGQAADLLNGPLKSVLDLLQNKLIEVLVDGLEKIVEPEIKENLTEMMLSIDEIGDLRSSLNGMDSPENYVSLIGQTLDSISSGTESPLLRQALLAEYCLAYMTRTVTQRVTDGHQDPIENVSGQSLADLATNRPAEIEQILTGAKTPEAATRHVRVLLTAVRSLINLADILADPDRMASLRTQAIASVAAISVASGATINIDPELLANFLAVGNAIKLGNQDYTDLSSGKSVALIPERLLERSVEFAYQDYLRVFLLALPQDTLAERIGGLIRKVMSSDFAHEVEITLTMADTYSAGQTGNQRSIRLAMAYDS